MSFRTYVEGYYYTGRDPNPAHRAYIHLALRGRSCLGGAKWRVQQCRKHWSDRQRHLQEDLRAEAQMHHLHPSQLRGRRHLLQVLPSQVFYLDAYGGVFLTLSLHSHPVPSTVAPQPPQPTVIVPALPQPQPAPEAPPTVRSYMETRPYS
jgi:hypothetical protein